MKKLLLIMIMAIALIPVTPIGASNKGMGEGYKVKVIDSQISLTPGLDVRNVSSDENRFQPVKIKWGKGIGKIDRTSKRLARRNIPANKRARLLSILLLAYGGKR